MGGNARGEHSAGKSVSAGRRDRRGGTHSGGKGLAPGERYAVLRPGAGDASKRWPVENFAEIARWLRERYALTPVVNLGPGDEEIAAEVRERLAPLSVDRRFAGLAATDGAARRSEPVRGERYRADAHRGGAAKEMRGDFWNERLCRLVPVENRTPRGGEQVSLRALPARTLCKLAGVAVHSHGQVEQVREACEALLVRARNRLRSGDSKKKDKKQIPRVDALGMTKRTSHRTSVG